MVELVEFKKEMKLKQKMEKKVIQRIKEEITALNETCTTPTSISSDDFAKFFPLLFIEINISKEYINYLNGDCSSPYLINLNEVPDEILKRVNSVYNSNQMIINGMDNDKIINYIDLERLLAHLIDSELSYESTLKIFGMVAGFDMLYIDKYGAKDQENDLFVELLRCIFGTDGNLLLSADSEKFKNILEKILFKYLLFYKQLEEDGKIPTGFFKRVENNSETLINAWCHLLRINNAKKELSEIVIEHLEEEASLTGLNPIISREPIESLKKYYKNGELIEVPDDLGAFTHLLSECKIDDNEKKYILKLIDEAKKSEENILKYLDEKDRKTYENAVTLLNRLNHTDGDYYILIQLLNDLKTVGDMLEEVNTQEEKEELFLEAETVLYDLKNILCKYTKEAKCENNIMFLLNENEVPYLKKDSDNLDGSFYKMVCSGIRKIRKENQGNFRLVMTNDNIPYRTYDILSSKVHISFIEIDSGVYLIIGVDAVNQGYENIVRRVIYNEMEIRKLEMLVKNDNTRNRVLSSHEEYLKLFNPDMPNSTRKRTTE